MRDLFELTEQDLDVTAPLWTPDFSHDHVLERVRELLDESNAQVPSTATLATKVLRSCARTEDAGRWRIRLYDVVSGWDFPFVGHNVVEFVRWFGPYRSAWEDPDPKRGAEYVADAGRNSDKWELLLHKALQRPEPPPAFLTHGIPNKPVRETDPVEANPDARQALWQRIRTERAELCIRLGETLLAARGEWTGAWGVHHIPLAGGTKRSRDLRLAPKPRHLWIEPAPRLPLAGPSLIGQVAQTRTAVLLLAPSGMAVHRIGDLVAEALGWSTVTNHDLVQRMRGHRVAPSHQDVDQTYKTMLRRLTRRPLDQSVVSFNMNYLFRTREPNDSTLQLHDEAAALLDHPAVLPVLLRPASRETFDLWEQRVRESAADPAHVSARDTRNGNLTTLHEWDKTIRPRLKQVWTARVAPTIPWSGPAVFPDEAFAPTWYRHPLIGDIAVRTAFEVCVRLLTGRDITTLRASDRRRIKFVGGSVLETNREALNTATPFGAKPWTAEPQPTTDYRIPPITSAPTGHVIEAWDGR